MKIILFILLSLLSFSALSYPSHWWGPTELTEPAPDWEILPEEGEVGKVLILSKRNELGILSNFAPTPFLFRNTNYASLEGFWQAMKYPENELDKRYGDDALPYSRRQVELMVAFEAKKAGSLASKLMKKHQVDWVSFEGRRMTYRDPKKGEHYKLIRGAMQAKLDQNPSVKKILLSTGDLVLKADHHTSINDPPAWKYYDIWMQERDLLPRD